MSRNFTLLLLEWGKMLDSSSHIDAVSSILNDDLMIVIARLDCK